ncbi:hypothetical protein ACRTAL_003365 [Clostridium perfringens]|uniref:Uncharacterized protein n=1 Tax=Clostridium perfringens TaxID=1502 RepID=A0AAW4J0T3_CLOPF|nr:hypothetical protein [Clostridium perfringens]EHP47421.1 hypothetical protein HMPREF9476_02160 [Clostridium perfringens WAL-14572]EJT6153927.1 hypothetical protein [Clostridium perfringens]ELC8348003.1 hypothetical protein [Clostridium perfringens]MBO3357151.1 hypothetical protein [Clostridium perfringens]MBO3360422.1 hypothetical protein [Clostridium perfringens]
MERKEIIKDIQDECILFDGNCIGGINQDGCSKVDLCMNLFGNKFLEKFNNGVKSNQISLLK